MRQNRIVTTQKLRKKAFQEVKHWQMLKKGRETADKNSFYAT